MVVDFALKPRLEARKARILKVHEHRDQLATHCLAITMNCARLKDSSAADDDPDLAALTPERERWRGKINESTLWLIDNMESFALSYPAHRGIQEVLVRYIVAARGIWLSEREEAAKLDLL